MERAKTIYEEKNQLLYKKETDVGRAEARLRAERAAFEQSKQELLHKAREEANNIVREARRSAEETIQSLKEQFDDHGIKERQKAIQAARSRLNEAYVHNISPKIPAEGRPVRPGEIQSGDTVYIRTLAQEGTVLSVQGKELSVQVGGLRTMVKMDACTFVGHQKRKKKINKIRVGGSLAQKSAEVRPQIDVRGMTVLEAEAVLEKFIDDAVFAGLSTVLVIHGKGTGALRLGLRDYFKRNKSIRAFSFADISEGGTGATVVTLK